MTAAQARRSLGYLRGCAEAEHAATESLSLDGSPDGSELPLLIERGAAPLAGTEAELAPSNRARRWARARRRRAGTERLWVGWPLVRGHRRLGGRRTEVVAGLLVAPVELVHEEADDGAEDPDDGGRARLVPIGAGLELGDEALDLLGVPSDERLLLRRDFDRALNRGRGDPFGAAARFLSARGLTPPSFDPRSLGPVDQSQATSNAAVAWVSRATRAPATTTVMAELDQLSRRAVLPQPVAGDDPGPLDALLVGVTGPQEPPPLEPVPGIAALDVQQEAAVAAALHRTLSVVTAPAGLARSDLVANTVAAAMARGERVLVVSHNDRALDLIDERLRRATGWSCPIRVGPDGLRSGAVESLERALTHEVDPYRSERYPTWWAVRADAEEPYGSLARRHELAWRLEDVTRRRSLLDASLPDGAPVEGGLDELTAALVPARELANAWLALPDRRPWHRPRLRAAERALDLALERVVAALEGPLREVARVRRDAGDRIGALELAETVAEVLATTDEITSLVAQLSDLPDEERSAREIEASYPTRRVAAAQLHEDRWADLLDAGLHLRTGADRYRDLLAGGDDPGRRADRHAAIGDLLAVLPVWLVTTSAVGDWFPLTPDLFDLVIVDDAGAAHVGPALPALARARRAQVIGDPAQLPPVTHVTTELDAQLAAVHDLSEDEHRRISHRRNSLLALATRAAGGPAVVLTRAAGVDPAIVSLLGRLWYGGRLRAGDPPPDGAAGTDGPAVRWVDHHGQFEPGRGGRSGRNAAEALVVVDEVLAQLTRLARSSGPRPPCAGPSGSGAAEPPGGAVGRHAGDDDPVTTDPDRPDDSGGSDDADDRNGSGTPDDDGGGSDDDRPAPDDRPVTHPWVLDPPVTHLRDAPVGSIGVVTLLSAQREALADLLLERFGRAITVDTPETFQGDERDVLIVSLVIGDDTRRELVEAVADEARLNVALAGARDRLVVVGDRRAATRADPRLDDLARAVAGLDRATADR